MDLPLVCVQGLGFVGAAMAVAIANAKKSDGSPRYQVIGVDLSSPEGTRRIESLQNGIFPFPSNDIEMSEALTRACSQGNFSTTSDREVYSRASIVVVDIHLDIDFSESIPQVHWDVFKSAIKTVADRVPKGSLLLIETTVPPGTTEKVVQPIVAESCRERGFNEDAIAIAHSYERVMPGPEYYRSIVNFWRAYSGTTAIAKERCREFLSAVIDVDRFPLTELESPTGSELAKIMENSFRATNIAFIQEWTAFADSIGVDLFDVIDAVRVRPTHNNIRFPGFGVGGYCLTKDPAFASISVNELFKLSGIDFPFCSLAMDTNKHMPLYSLEKLRKLLGNSLKEKTFLLAGISYRSEVGDTRFSPAEIFVREAEKEGAIFILHDPYVAHWDDMDREIERELPALQNVDAVIFAVNHSEYRNIDFRTWLESAHPVIFDASNVLSQEQRHYIEQANISHCFIGHGRMGTGGET